ncbi:MAG: hypothetical protein KDC44_00240 [Phaeodactylibacter sp.]|nr:hypothetical protein [Phaeodactylibacter sp.]
MSLLRLSISDFKNIFREQILYFMFIGAPILQYGLFRWGLPWVVGQYPVVEPYTGLILALLTLQVVGGIGFVLASILLDERDDGVLTALRITPIGPNAFLFYRMFMGMLIGWIFALIMLRWNGIVQLEWPVVVAGALLLAAMAPMIMLVMATFSKNKVEGLAMYKGINFVLMLPLAGIFLPDAWGQLFAFLPTHWTLHFLDQAYKGNILYHYFLIGFPVHLAFLWLMVRQFRKRVFESVAELI